jgi:hypothetical protein
MIEEIQAIMDHIHQQLLLIKDFVNLFEIEMKNQNNLIHLDLFVYEDNQLLLVHLKDPIRK